MIRVLQGDARAVLPTLEAGSANMICTSPPYFRQRSYLKADHSDKALEIGNEPTPEAYVETIVGVMREARRVLRDDGSLWLNLGDSFSSGGGAHGGRTDNQIGVGARRAHENGGGDQDARRAPIGLKPKDLIGIPWMVAFALRSDGWYLRSDNVWGKPNCLSGGVWLYAKTVQSVGPMMLKDLVRLAPNTVQLWNGERWTRVSAWRRNDDPGEAIEIVLRSGERIGCTADHIWPTADGREVTAGELNVGDRLRHCRTPETTKHAPWLNSDAFWFAGLYLAEGHTDKNSRAIIISGHVKEADRIKRLRRLVAHYGGSIAVHDTGGNSQIAVLCSPALASVLRTLVAGETAHDKRLTASAWASATGALRDLAEGYLHGDGHEDGARVRLGFCRNYSLERDIRALAARLGATLTLRPKTSRSQTGVFPSFKGEWRWSRSGHLNEKDRSEIIELRRSRARQFWDVTVEDDPHLFALASGVLTHNCMPESCRDRTTRSHEYVFHLTKSERYYYNLEAVRTAPKASTQTQLATPYTGQSRKGHDGTGVQNASDIKRRIVDKQRGHSRRHDGFNARWDAMERDEQMAEGGNLRSVWWISPAQYGYEPDYDNADYVDERGIPRKVSLDCPVHGLSSTSRIPSPEATACDELPILQENHIHNIGSDPSLELYPGSPTTESYIPPAPSDSPSSETHESIAENRTPDLLMARLQMPSSSSDIPPQSESMLGCFPDADAQTATARNTGTRKNGPAPLFASHDTPSDETPSDILGTPSQSACLVDDRHTDESSILAHLFLEPEMASDRPLTVRRTRSRGNGRSYKNATCTCPVSQASHFAVMPDEVAEICIRAGCPPGGTVLDPFAGVFTTCLVADRLQCDAIGIELAANHCDMARRRIEADAGMFGEVCNG